MNACADITILHGDNYNSFKKKLKDLKQVNFKAKIAVRYCKSQTIAVCKGISILIIQLKEQSEPLGTKQLTTL